MALPGTWWKFEKIKNKNLSYTLTNRMNQKCFYSPLILFPKKGQETPIPISPNLYHQFSLLLSLLDVMIPEKRGCHRLDTPDPLTFMSRVQSEGDGQNDHYPTEFTWQPEDAGWLSWYVIDLFPNWYLSGLFSTPRSVISRLLSPLLLMSD